MIWERNMVDSCCIISTSCTDTRVRADISCPKFHLLYCDGFMLISFMILLMVQNFKQVKDLDPFLYNNC